MVSQFGKPISHAKKIAALRNLKPGDAHADLVEVQNYLRRYGYFKPEEPCEAGKLCPATTRVLTSFQKFFNVDPSGSFDEATRHWMSAPRCGVADFSELEARTTAAWDHGDLTYTFGNSTSQAVGADAARNAVRAAFATWAGTVEFLSAQEVEPDDDPDIRVEWRQAADPDHDMRGGVLAHAEFPPSSSFHGSGRPLPLHFDQEEHIWVVGAQPNSFDIETVALHEIGHCLGILHTSVVGSVMYPSVLLNFTLRNPQPDDLVAIRRLYERDEE